MWSYIMSHTKVANKIMNFIFTVIILFQLTKVGKSQIPRKLSCYLDVKNDFYSARCQPFLVIYYLIVRVLLC